MTIHMRVTVRLKKSVHDPQGLAVKTGLDTLGFRGIASVRQGKVFDIELAHEDPVAAQRDVETMCQKLLANLVIEDYKIEPVAAS